MQLFLSLFEVQRLFSRNDKWQSLLLELSLDE